MSLAISFEHVSKHFRGVYDYVTLREDFFQALGHYTGLRRSTRTVVRALEDVSFEIREGESCALIGTNGAGKTTALKLATRIAYPTGGRIRVRGRVGALIEVGTGVHPELTGRENIHLYGRILGLSRRDIRQRFDPIVEFADIGPALDQPVKQYSSGMRLRLGFSVAVHIEPDVFLVDEALAVGDAAFQYRCVERMGELVREGRTLVFVSHSMSAIEALCDRALLLREGRIVEDGPASAVVRSYLHGVETAHLAAEAADRGTVVGHDVDITRVTLRDGAGSEIEEAAPGEPLTVRIHFRAHRPIAGPIFEVGLNDGRLGPFAVASMLLDGEVPAEIRGRGHVDCTFETLPLHPRLYELWGGIREPGGYGELVPWQRLRLFRVGGEVVDPGLAAVSQSFESAPVRLPYSWRVVSDAPDAPS